MLEVSNVSVPLDGALPQGKRVLFQAVADKLKVAPDCIDTVRILKKSVDARKKSAIHFVMTLAVALTSESQEMALIYQANVKTDSAIVINERRGPASMFDMRAGSDVKASVPVSKFVVPSLPESLLPQDYKRPVVVGSGPAGLFAALYLARAGLRPLLVERGASVDERVAAVEHFEKTGELNASTNIQFGEGGAGTFSDGKLTTNTKNPLTKTVLEWFAQAGAPEEILVDAKPHIGTDKLRAVVKTLREQIIQHGGEVRFNCQLVDLEFCDNELTGVVLEDTACGTRQSISASTVILACGHSARDTFALLQEKGLFMERKPFSVGVRIEHPQRMINQAQYGDFADHPALGAADYKLSAHLPNGRGVYTFCMCPGGQVVAATSEEGGVVVNGMSVHARDGENANSAVLVSVEPADFPGTDPLAGVAFQRDLEQAAYRLAQKNGGAPYAAPAQKVGDFLHASQTKKPKNAHACKGGHVSCAPVTPTYARGVAWSDLHECLPDFVAQSLEQALPQFDRRIKGFASDNAVMTAVETRSSSPVRLVRDSGSLQAFFNDGSVAAAGVYPCGEGAGYAGGIMSAAVDGIRVAEAVARDLSPIDLQAYARDVSTPGVTAVPCQGRSSKGARFAESRKTDGEASSDDSDPGDAAGNDSAGALGAAKGAVASTVVDAVVDATDALDVQAAGAMGAGDAQVAGAAADDATAASAPVVEKTYTDNTGARFTYRELADGTLRMMSCENAIDQVICDAYVEGQLVSEIDSRAFLNIGRLRTLVFPAGVRRAQAGLLRRLPRIETLVLPDAMASLDTALIASLSQIETLQLPAMLARVPMGLFRSTNIRVLRIGRNTRDVAQGTFADTTLERVEVDPHNPWLSTDGQGIYRKSDGALLSLAVNVSHYRVRKDCPRICHKAFANREDLLSVELPEGVSVIEPFAFFRSGVRSFTAPTSLRAIERRAFALCEQLQEVHLNEGLRAIGEEAFANTALREIELPASLQALGRRFCGTPRLIACEDGSEKFLPEVRIAPGSVHFLIDDQQGLYQYTEQGLIFAELLNSSAKEYALDSRTRAIAPGAFARQANLVSVELPASLQDIGAQAFSGCSLLARLEGSPALRSIGNGAFSGTALQALYLPATMERLGKNALVVREGTGFVPPRLIAQVKLDPQCPAFFFDNQFLCQRLASGGVAVIMYCGEKRHVHIPDCATEVRAFCLVNVDNLESIETHDGIAFYGTNCFLNAQIPHTVTVNLNKQPLQGHRRIVLQYPNNSTGRDALRQSFTSRNYLPGAGFNKHGFSQMMWGGSPSDKDETDLPSSSHERAAGLSSLVQALTGNAPVADEGELVSQTSSQPGAGAWDAAAALRCSDEAMYWCPSTLRSMAYALGRLSDPLFLGAESRTRFEPMIARRLGEVVRIFARNNYLQGFDQLFSLGFITKENVIEMIDVAGNVDNVEVTSHLFELRRRFFGYDVMSEFDL